MIFRGLRRGIGFGGPYQREGENEGAAKIISALSVFGDSNVLFREEGLREYKDGDWENILDARQLR